MLMIWKSIWISVVMINNTLVMIALTQQVLGKVKDEHDGQIFIQHMVLKPNMYCCETDDRKALKQR